MGLAVLLLLLLSALAGLAAGRRRAVLPAAAAVIPCAIVGGVAIAGLALLAAAGLAAGVHLHRVVADEGVRPLNNVNVKGSDPYFRLFSSRSIFR